MAFPAINAQQELNNRKILEELQLKKHLLTKGGLPASTGLPGGAFSTSTSNPTAAAAVASVPTTPTTTPLIGNATQQLQQQQQHQQQSQQNDITFNNTSRAAWLQATNQSSCFFLHQDSGYGNSILPVLPRFDP